MPMTTDKLTPTHPLIQSLSPVRLQPLHPRQAPVPGSTSAHTGRTTQSDPLSSHLSDFLPWGDRHNLRLPPEGPSGQVSHHKGSPRVCCLVLTWHLHFESSVIFTATHRWSLYISLPITRLGLCHSWILFQNFLSLFFGNMFFHLLYVLLLIAKIKLCQLAFYLLSWN